MEFSKSALDQLISKNLKFGQNSFCKTNQRKITSFRSLRKYDHQKNDILKEENLNSYIDFIYNEIKGSMDFG